MRKTKRVLATALALAMAVTVIPANIAKADDPIDWNNNGGTSTVTGEGTVIQPVMEVALPGDLAFEVDPSNIEITNTQVLGGDYNVVNYGTVDVQVKVEPHITTLEGSTLEISNAAPAKSTVTGYTDTYSELTSSSGKKKVFLAAIAGDKATTLADANKDGIYEFAYAGTAAIMGRGALVYDTEANEYALKKGDVTSAFGTVTAAETYKILDTAALTDTSVLDDSKAAFIFDLDKATYDDDGALTSVNSVGSFTIVGAVDPTKTYEDGEIAVHALYKMNILTAQAKVGFEAADATNKMATCVKAKQ